jgi:hypothetical protein
MRFVWRSFQTVMLSIFFKLSALNAQKKAAIPHGYVTGWWRCQSRRRAPTALNGMMRFL